MDKTYIERDVNSSLRHAIINTKMRCEVDENEKHNRWRITLVDSSHRSSYTRTKWLGKSSAIYVMTGMDMVLAHISSRETFFQEIGHKYCDILGIKEEYHEDS